MTTQCGQRTRDAAAPLTYTPAPDEPHTAVPAPSRRRSTRPVGLPKPKAVTHTHTHTRTHAHAHTHTHTHTKELSKVVR